MSSSATAIGTAQISFSRAFILFSFQQQFQPFVAVFPFITLLSTFRIQSFISFNNNTLQCKTPFIPFHGLPASAASAFIPRAHLIGILYSIPENKSPPPSNRTMAEGWVCPSSSLFKKLGSSSSRYISRCFAHLR